MTEFVQALAQNKIQKISIGLENLWKRLKINFRMKARIDIERKDGLVTATIVLPLEG